MGGGGEELSPPQRLLLVNTRERKGGKRESVFSHGQGATVGGLCGGERGTKQGRGVTFILSVGEGRLKFIFAK